MGAVASVVVLLVAIALAVEVRTSSRTCSAVCPVLYPVGTRSATAVSGVAPPPSRFPGYRLVSRTVFTGTTLGMGWYPFSGPPIGDAGTSFSPRHVVVAKGVLSLNAFRVPTSHNIWMTGGVCDCGHPFRYGAVFVRSRMTGAGATHVALLWPRVGRGPEVDFDETFGGILQATATVHYGPHDTQQHRVTAVAMKRWHTWGVIWTPTALTYVLDGHVWGRVTTPAAIPHVAMSVHLQQQTWCSHHFACPTSLVSTQVAWVARYATAA